MSIETLKESAKEKEYELIHFNTGKRAVDVYSTPISFRPNRVSEAFIKGLPLNLKEKIVYDIGSGGGIIALEEAFRGAREVHAVEPADSNFELLLKNIELNEQQYPEIRGKIIPYKGIYFDPLQGIEKADIITADVSGIPNIFGRALGWYPQGIETGGVEGYEITCELLKRAPYHIKPDGFLLFPTADDLLDSEVILNSARQNFGKLENALCSEKELDDWIEKAVKSNGKEWRSPDYVWFVLREEDIEKLKAAYGKIPETIKLQEVRGKKFWRGKIWKAMDPILS